MRHCLDDLSYQLGAAVRREKASLVRGLYVIIDPEVTAGRAAAGHCQGGGQRRGPDASNCETSSATKGETLPLALALQDLCETTEVQLIINDHADLAAAVGSPDCTWARPTCRLAQARRVLQPDQVLGRSNRELDLLVESQDMGADHVAFGAIYKTGTKPGGRAAQGPDRLRAAREVTHVPLVAIGGITADNVLPVVETGRRRHLRRRSRRAWPESRKLQPPGWYRLSRTPGEGFNADQIQRGPFGDRATGDRPTQRPEPRP